MNLPMCLLALCQRMVSLDSQQEDMQHLQQSNMTQEDLLVSQERVLFLKKQQNHGLNQVNDNQKEEIGSLHHILLDNRLHKNLFDFMVKTKISLFFQTNVTHSLNICLKK